MISTDSLQTWLGCLEAILISVGGVVYAAMSDPNGFDWKSPVLWGAVVLAAVRAIKGYFAAGIKLPAMPGAVVPVKTPTIAPVVVLAVLVLGTMTACASYIDYGDGRYGVTRVSEQRSPFGTNAGFAYMENCEGRKDNIGALAFTDCHAMTPIASVSSQGQGGQIVGGALTGLGFGLGSAFSGASNSASAVSSSASTAAKGGHH